VIPYIHVPDMQIGPVPLHPFGLLVATGVLLGTWITTWRAKKIGYDVDLLNSFITWMLVAGFIGGHVFDEIFYHPDRIVWSAEHPWSLKERGPQTLLWLWDGLSSFGGFLGALIGIILWKFLEWAPPDRTPEGKHLVGRLYARKTTLPLLPFADIVLSVFPFAWVFGRGGCSVVHDHPGMLAKAGALFAVEWPNAKEAPLASDGIRLIHGSVIRYDLGLLEWMFTVIVAAAFIATWHKKVQTGTYIAAVALAYAPVRFVMDYLRITDTDQADLRYGSLTFAQWMCIALFTFGAAMVFLMRQHRQEGYDPATLIMERPEPEEEEAPPPPPRRVKKRAS